MALPSRKDPYTGQDASLNEFQQLAEQPDFARKNPTLAAAYKYRHGYQPENQLGYNLGRMANNGFNQFVQRPFAHFANKGPVQGGLAAGIPSALLGAVGAMGVNAVTGSDVPVGRTALLLGLLGAGAGAWSGHMRTKEAAMFGASLDQKIMTAVQQSGGLSLQDQAKIMQGLQRLPRQDKQMLWQAIASAVGASVGALVMRFLVSKGAIATSAGALLGGMLGNSLFTRSAQNSSLSRKDFSGRQYAY